MPETKPQPPDDTRVEEEHIAAGKSGTYGKRKFTTARHGMTGKNLNMDDIDKEPLGGGDDEMDVTLSKMQALEVDTTQKQLASLRKTHDEHRSMAEAKLQQLKQIEEELAEVRRLNTHKESDSSKSSNGLSSVENRLDITQMKLEEELQNKEIFTHMIKRLTSGLLDAKSNVKTTNEQKLQAEAEYQGLRLQLHQARQEQSNLEDALKSLSKKAKTRREKQDQKLVDIQKAIDQRASQRIRQEDMEKKREAIAARAKGDLGTEEEERLKRMFVVRSLYSSMLEQKVQKEAADLEHMEQGFQKIKSATGISDVQEIIQKFKTKDETKHSLLQTDKQTRDRIEQLKEEKADNLAILEDATTTGMAAGGNREMYQEVDHIDEALNAARKQMNDYKTRATRLDLILEESRMSIRKFLSKLNNTTSDLPSMEELPDKIEEVDVKVARLMKNVLASLEVLGTGDGEKVPERATSSSISSAGDEVKVSTPFGHANEAKVNDMLFHNMMNIEPDTSGRNVRVNPTPSIKMEEAVQTSAASTLRNLVEQTDDMSDLDRHDLTSFLTSDAGNVGQVTGILKQMGDTMSATLGDVVAKEEASVKSYDALIAAKTAEVEALTAAIEEKTVRIGELGVEIVQMKADLSDSEASLIDDKKFAADLGKNCATKEAEWAEVCKTRSEEILALADTIKILNDDDALEMFKKTLPGAGSASFMQVEVSEDAIRVRALALLQEAKVGKKSERQRIDFIMLALRGKKIGFEKVLKMIDDMVALMKQEQLDDESKKEYCEMQFDHADDKKKGLERTEGKLEKAIAEAKESVATLKDEIAALGEGIVALDKSVAEATDQRREENSDYKTLMVNNQAAKELLEFAKNRLNKFYNPKLYKPPAMFMQISAHRGKADPGPAPEAPGAHKKQDGNGVISMIDTLVKDLDTEMTEAEFNEKDAQEEYEEMMSDSSAKRAADTKSVADKSAAQADAESLIVAKSETLTSTQKELMATHEYIGQLHGECDWILKFFDVRATARLGEIDGLKKAKAVLSGADFSLVQKSARRFLRK